MKILVIFLGLIFSVSARAETSPRTDEQLFAALSSRTGISVESMDFFQTASASDAWTVFSFLNSHLPIEENEFLKRAGRVIAENPGIEKYVTEGMAKLPHDFYNEGDRARYLYPLGYVPAPWSLRLLGHYLTDETPMTAEGEAPDYGSVTNQGMAIAALTAMGFSDAPPEDKIHGQTPAVEKGWHDWWKANEGRVEQRIREINPGYYPPQPAATATPATPTPAVAGEYASPPAVGNTPKPTPSATPVAAVPARQSDWAIYAIGGLVALAALVAVGWAMRKR